MVVRGHVENGVVILDDGVQLPEGQAVTVQVPPPADEKGHSILDIPPVSMGKMLRPLSPDDDLLDEMLEGRSAALRGLIGVWKTAQPPSDEDVNRIVEEEKMRKYG